MIGRKQELDLLEKLYTSPSFQFLIMYGRRRVGKTIPAKFCLRLMIVFSSQPRKRMMPSIGKIFHERSRNIIRMIILPIS